MTEDELSKLLFSDPDKLFELYEQRGGDYVSFRKLNIARKIIQKKYDDEITDDQFVAADFVFWISYFAEREIGDIISSIEKSKGKDPVGVEEMLDDMPFGQKIIFIKDNYADQRSADFIEILRQVKTLRNHVAHGRFDQLKYAEYYLSDPRGQIKLIIAISSAAQRKKS